MVTDNTYQSDWVNWEIRESLRMGKGVVVIDKRKSSASRMPDAVNESKDKIKVVPWKHEAMINAIDEAAENR